jgi:hypothetical protein
VSGVFLGVGLAVQPLFKLVLNGIVFDATSIKKCETVTLMDGKYTGTVIHIGLLHTWIKLTKGENEGNLVMINNQLLESHPIIVCDEATHILKGQTSVLKFL